MKYAQKIKKALVVVLMMAVVGAAGVKSAKAESVTTANLGVGMSFDDTIRMLYSQDLSFRLVRNVSRNGHYTYVDFGIPSSPTADDLENSNSNCGTVMLAGMPNTKVLVSIPPVVLSDGAGHTATLHLAAVYWVLGAAFPSMTLSSNATFSVSLGGGNAGWYSYGLTDADAGENIDLYPASLDFASGSDVLGNWTGTASITVDYTE